MPRLWLLQGRRQIPIRPSGSESQAATFCQLSAIRRGVGDMSAGLEWRRVFTRRTSAEVNNQATVRRTKRGREMGQRRRYSHNVSSSKRCVRRWTCMQPPHFDEIISSCDRLDLKGTFRKMASLLHVSESISHPLEELVVVEKQG